MTGIPLDTQSLSERVRHYLNYNHIQYNRFSSLVLGVSQSRLSNLLRKPKPWNILSKRVQALYERMQLWMDTRATYGNNPYYRQKVNGKVKSKKGKRVVNKKQRSLLEGDETIEILRQLEDYTASKELVAEGFKVQEPVAEQETCMIQEVVEGGEEEDLDMIAIATTMSNQIMVGQTVIDDETMNEQILGTQIQEFSVDVEGLYWDALENIIGSGKSSTQGVQENEKKLEDTNSIVIYQMEEEIPVCQVFVEESPVEAGTYNLSIIEVSTEESVTN